ncbi:MAG: N-acetyltransferase [Gorillibacterium sp.]|nr:N-acetyltransferase [Gorillibacterium sp.]
MKRSITEHGDIIVRMEQVGDYHAVAEIDTQAFTYAPYVSEGILTAALRQRKTFDPELSLVAEVAGDVAGHLLFSPYIFRIEGCDIPTVILAPLAVKPEYQGIGVGSKLVRQGLAIAKQKGYVLSLLLGHSDYYPRFGYLTRAFGKSFARINYADLPPIPSTLVERRVRLEDIPALLLLWEKWYGEANGVLKPGEAITDWICMNRLFCSSVLWKDQELIGFIRYATDDPSQVFMLLSISPSATADMLGYLGSLAVKAGKSVLEISLPINNRRNDTVLPCKYEWVNQLWDAAMVHILDESYSKLQAYFERVRQNEEKPGPVIWPVEFET